MVRQRTLTPPTEGSNPSTPTTRLLGGTVDADDLKSSIREDIPVRIRKEPPLREDGEMADTGDSKSPAHRELAGSSPAFPTT